MPWGKAPVILPWSRTSEFFLREENDVVLTSVLKKKGTSWDAPTMLVGKVLRQVLFSCIPGVDTSMLEGALIWHRQRPLPMVCAGPVPLHSDKTSWLNNTMASICPCFAAVPLDGTKCLFQNIMQDSHVTISTHSAFPFGRPESGSKDNDKQFQVGLQCIILTLF